MIKSRLFLLISLLFFKASIAKDFNCSPDFEKLKELSCSSLSNSNQYCLLVDNECREWYRTC